jgi:clan AA aspartic protease
MKRIQGWWGPNLTPYIQVSTPTGELLNLIVDSGFNGELVLPKSLIKKLGFKRRGSTTVELADGSTVLTPTYRGTILWFGRRKAVAVHTTKAHEGLLGTQLFRGCTVELDLDKNRVLFRKK